MSISLLRYLVNPPPVPDEPTITSTSPLTWAKASCAALLIRKTVLDPSTLTWSPPASSAPPPHPARVATSPSATIQPKERARCVGEVMLMDVSWSGL